MLDWDPSKWIILLLRRFGLVTGLRQAREEDISSARWHMDAKTHSHGSHGHGLEFPETSVADMTLAEVQAYIERQGSRHVLLIDGWVVDATTYVSEHVRPAFGNVFDIQTDRSYISLEVLLSYASIR
jgi:stearoyl-CoA desaturase (Delta-9 desaturase)